VATVLERSPAPEAPSRPARWGKVIDDRRCIGCHACTTACKMEHGVPLGVTRTYVKQVDVGVYPTIRRHFQVTRCNQCENPPCVAICPVKAMYRRPDGIVDFDRDLCIGCQSCIAACPYDAIYIDPASRSAEKCNFCAHRIEQGLEPACVIVCPERAIIVGDLSDPRSEVSHLAAREKVAVRKPEKGTDPKVMYIEASRFTLVPGSARVPPTHSYSQQREEYPPDPAGSESDPAVLAYDVPHRAPWDWRVSAYTWAKSVAAGAYLLQAVFSLTNISLPAGWGFTANLTALVFLLLTGVLLVADLKHPERFHSVLLRPQWRSWLARGGYTITIYGAVLGLDLIARLAGWTGLPPYLAILGLPLAALTAMYTAFLFAQAKGRDLWQNPLLPVHLLTQAALAGAAVLLVIPGTPAAAAWTLAGALTLHLLLVFSEALIPHPTRDGARAARHMLTGAYSRYYWLSVTLAVLAGASACTGVLLAPGGLLALAALLAYEHAYVQSGQSIPLS